jgi:pimeloyl-ACP methyl ester carboxylesterase
MIWTHFLSSFLLLMVMGNSMAAEIVPGVLHHIETHLGKVEIRVVGENIPGRVPIICIPGISAALKDEWTNVVEPLSQHGYVAAIIHFHSNPKTAPALLAGGIQPRDVSKIVNEAVLANFFNTDRAVIMGKSWGGYMAAMHATSHPAKVVKLVLLAPAFSTADRAIALHKVGVPTFLGWAKDDSSVWYSTHKLWRDEFGEDLTFYAAEKGGHTVIPEYAGPVLKFLKE